MPQQPSGFVPDGFVADAAPVTGAHPEARIGAADPNRPVTLGDLQEDPVAAIARIGQIVKKDVSDPRLWMTLAAGYLAPKVFSAAAPGIARAAAGAKAGLSEVATPGMVKDLATVGLGEGRVSAGIRIGERVADAARAVRSAPTESSPSAPTLPAAEAAPGSLPATPEAPAPSPAASGMSPQQALNEAALARRRAEYQAQVSETPTPSEVAKLKLSAAETSALLNLLKRGTPGPQALEHVLMQRDLAARLGTMSTAQMDAEIANRVGNRSPQR